MGGVELMSEIAIVGAGMMGTALCWPLTDNGHSVALVGTHLDADVISRCQKEHYHPTLNRTLPGNVKPYYLEQIDQALERAKIVVCGVNSLGIRWIARTLKPLLRSGQKIIAVTKGLEYSSEEGLRLLPDVLLDELEQTTADRIPIAAIGGPCIAGELAGRRVSCVVFTSRNPDILKPLKDLFQTSYYNIWLSTDMVGVELCAALKNAYTIAVGIAQGILERSGGEDHAHASMYNLSAALFGAGASEMFRIVSLMGGNPRNVASLPGVGDNYVTSMGGRTVRLGRLLGKGMRYTQAKEALAGVTLEGAYVLQQLNRTLPYWEEKGVLSSHELPLLRWLCRIVTEDRPAEIPVDELRMAEQQIGSEVAGSANASDTIGISRRFKRSENKPIR
jgi:glycerol-3-phosphate dehydrogenase (NAD(P)+)